LKDIKKNTDPSSPEKQALDVALQKLSEAAAQIDHATGYSFDLSISI